MVAERSCRGSSPSQCGCRGLAMAAWEAGAVVLHARCAGAVRTSVCNIKVTFLGVASVVARAASDYAAASAGLLPTPGFLKQWQCSRGGEAEPQHCNTDGNSERQARRT